MFAGLLSTPLAFSLEHRAASSLAQEDSRLVRLRKFFERYHCPLSKYAADFVLAADENNLDWRLLPSISMMESGGGKSYRNRNVFGWDSGHQHFASIQAGIHAVASRLGTSQLYRHKQLDQILTTYNSRPEYARRVKNWMQTLSPARQTFASAFY